VRICIKIGNQSQKNTAELSQKYSEQITQKENEINQLKLTKSNLQVKMLGEELERWCNSKYELFVLSGFRHCCLRGMTKGVKGITITFSRVNFYVFLPYANFRNTL